MTSYLAQKSRHLSRFLSFLALFTAISIGGGITTLPSVHAQTAGDVSYQYDALGRLTVVTYSNGTIVEYNYDAAGNRTTVLALPGAGDSVPVIGQGANLIDLSGWPVGEAPAGSAAVSGWVASNFADEARWLRVTGPGQSGTITAMDVGQTEADAAGGGAAQVNWFNIDPTRAYEYTIYFRKHDLGVQNIYFGPHQYYPAGTEYLSYAYGSGAPTNNPYSIQWSTSTQASLLDPAKWYKIVSYVLPEGHPLEDRADWGGVYDVETGSKIADVNVFRWNPDRPDDKGQARFFTYYDEATQGVYTTYFYRPEARVTNITYTPVEPTIGSSHVDAAEGGDITFTVSLSEATTVPVRVDYVVDHDGAADSAEADDYTPISLTTLTFPEGATSATVTVNTIDNGTYEGDEAVRLTLSNPVRGTITAGQEVEEALILDSGDAPGFTVNDVTATEGGNIVFTVTKTGSTELSHNISRATADGTATAGSDYTAKSLAAWTYAPGEVTKSITVSTTADTTYENNETVLLNLSSATNGATITDSQGLGTINNDDAGPSFAIDDVSQPEGTDIVFTVTKTGSTAFSHNVSFATANVTAGASDYNANSGALTFAAGDTTKTITVTTLADANYEPTETFVVNLTSPTAGATITDAQGTGTVANDDPPPSFSVGDVSITEGGNLTFTVTKTGGTRLSHNVSYATANNTAVAGTDYTSKSGTLSFAADTYTATVTVVTSQDTIDEPNETLYLNLSGATNSATISDAQGLGTINDDDTPSFAINDTSASEGNVMTFTVTRTGTTVQTLSVNYATSSGTATSATDFTAASGTLTFAPADTTKTFTVTTVEDVIYENAETLTSTLSGATGGAAISDATGTGTINNDDAGPSFTIDDVSQPEGTNIVFTVTKSGSTALSHSVNFATANVTAGASDYNANSGTLTFAAGDTTKTITVSTIADSNYEPSETFVVNLSAATAGATIADAQGTGTVANDDSPPSFSVNDVSVTESGNLTFTVTKTGGTRLSHNVSYATANGTAAAGSDYTSKSGTLSFAADTYTATVTVSITNDPNYEGNETLYLNLSGATNSATISDSQGLGTIIDDDPLASNDSSSMPQWNTDNFYVLNNDSDPNGDPLSITSLVNPGGATIFGTISCGGTCIEVNAIGTGTYSITYTISDGNGGSDSALLTITVTGGGGGPFD